MISAVHRPELLQPRDGGLHAGFHRVSLGTEHQAGVLLRVSSASPMLRNRKDGLVPAVLHQLGIAAQGKAAAVRGLNFLHFYLRQLEAAV